MGETNRARRDAQVDAEAIFRVASDYLSYSQESQESSLSLSLSLSLFLVERTRVAKRVLSHRCA